jgi:glyoxylase-like metal-dependent hydrolase (beta-lactamase superfamily II)
VTGFLAGAAALLLTAAAPARADGLAARFLGNEAFEITDGKTTLLTDFPYRSGAFGYMAYDPAELRPRREALCLITHGHEDHFEADLVERLGCQVLGPPDVLERVSKWLVLSGPAPIRFRDLAITPVATDHARVGHFSYLVEWAGLRLYFTGDTEVVRELSAQRSLDALFISPWLLEAAGKARALPEASRIVVYHHQAAETVPFCPHCIVPRQGQIVEIPAATPKRARLSP